ncbi:MAG: hypothetical protein WBF17_27345 [Phycisphaerae bacterium]
MVCSRRLRLLAYALVTVCAAGPIAARAGEPPDPGGDPEALARLWEALGCGERVKTAAAVLELIGRGDSAVGFLSEKLRPQKMPLDKDKVASLVEELDSEKWQVRQKAQAQLAALGPPIIPLLRDVLRKGASAEVKVRIEAVLRELDDSAKGSPASLRRSWATTALGRIGSARALEALVSLRGGAGEDQLRWTKAALLNLAETALPPLLDAAGAKARDRKYAAAADLCRKALAIADKADHYGKGRIRPILEYLRARQEGRKPPAGMPNERIGWQRVRGENLLGNGGFEAGRAGGSWPTICGTWGGDKAELLGAQQGVAPRAGRRMLRFHHTNYSRPDASNGAQVLQVIDVSNFREAIRAGRARVVASALFNRVAGNAQTDTLFGLTLLAHSGSPAQHARLKEPIRLECAAIITDSDPGTWEKLAASMPLPTDTGFLAIQLMAVEDIFNDAVGVEFHGHYVDDAFLTVVAEPAAGQGARRQRQDGLGAEAP